MTIGKTLKNLREEMRNTLKEQSEIFDVSLNTVFRWEHDLSVPRNSMLKKISEYYGVTPEWLLGETTPWKDHVNAPYQNYQELQFLSMFRMLPEKTRSRLIKCVEYLFDESVDETMNLAVPQTETLWEVG